MSIPKPPDLSVFNYHLPDEKIAKHPLANRDDAKLLYYHKGDIQDRIFKESTEFLNDQTTLFFNNTKVIPARLHFQKDTGAHIEIFLLKPVSPTSIISTIMESSGPVIWECMVGNLKRWKEGTVLSRALNAHQQEIMLTATLVSREKRTVSLSWDNENFSFAEVVEMAGQVPLPPYLNRDAEPEDKPRYQTVYSKEEGAVAAPTAGLHFTDEILEELKKKGVRESFLTLHVSAGTFQPIKVDDAREHPMHSEQIEVTIDTIQDLVNAQRVVAVGTTSMRSLESLYWFGVRLARGNEEFSIEKLELYQDGELPNRGAAFSNIYDWMKAKGLERLSGSTEIFIMPGYQFRVCDGLFTNFHQPGSTLMLLVAAFIGKDWQKVYNHGLENGYRFLSYGDSSLLLP
ncbi:S-adenosylmethionine:tRNA ribosyltransferase-isomerase [Roseivirga sp. E12]|uniref:S-adenosylmethionine:tRNA ribosyltransferase-isomerase n=1 Tax=Roseivirga sp. E12 TaxID=2819237 RepID=UPI001ABCE58E|nr:S-adenosylmethionine:tRNA ribosyltransferase-isomerase [Roseivirga sp. E12]MBO3700572.1 S-adenosylmethionine:tRNA ribosyltransferase-isomerase [Roseivirga sp. E12]